MRPRVGFDSVMEPGNGWNQGQACPRFGLRTTPQHCAAVFNGAGKEAIACYWSADNSPVEIPDPSGD